MPLGAFVLLFRPGGGNGTSAPGAFLFGDDSMGAWGLSAFENDSALDWVLLRLENASDLSVLEAAIEGIELTAPDSIDFFTEETQIALAACDVLARLRGNWGRENKDVDYWVFKHPIVPPADLLRRARAVVGRTMLRAMRDDDEIHAQLTALVLRLT